MLTQLKDYKTVVTLGLYKIDIFSSVNNKQRLKETLSKTIAYLENNYSATEEYNSSIEKSKETAYRLLDYITDTKNSLEGEQFLNLLTNTLDGYFIPLNTLGTEVERVCWMETIISKFIEEFSDDNINGDKKLEEVVRKLKEDIDSTYTDTFNSHMKSYVSNYSEFILVVDKLGISNKKASKVNSSNIFKKDNL